MAVAKVNLRERQAPIRDRYKTAPETARIVLGVSSARSDLRDPLHCGVVPKSAPSVVWRSGAHQAVGGDGDVPCSGDLLIGALAACQETTIRMVAANMGIELESLEVEVEADWDARGTLAMGAYPIGLTAHPLYDERPSAGRRPGRAGGPLAPERRKVLRRAQYSPQRRSGRVYLCSRAGE